MSGPSGSGPVTFLSDFGMADSYVAEVKGAVFSVDRGLVVVDVTHDVPRHDVRFGAFQLFRAVSAFPAGTVHLAVVDPGVGTDRRGVVAEAGGHVLVGPDNGLLSWGVGALDGRKTWRVIDRPDLCRNGASLTFHGRDVFGPVAASIAAGIVEVRDIGPIIDDAVTLPWPESKVGRGFASAEVIVVDSFGNVIISLNSDKLAGMMSDGDLLNVVASGSSFEGTWGTYGSATGLVVHPDSSGLVEMAVKGGSAAGRLGSAPGDLIEIRWGA